MNNKHISIIACISKNNALGKNNGLLYHLPNDMKMFKEMTTGKTVIMGSKTYYSFPKGALPNRENIVVSHSNLDIKDAKVCNSINEAIEASTNDEVFIIGGGQIYKQAINMADTMYLTIVDDICKDADTFFPEWGDEWKKTYDSPHLADEKHKYNYRFTIWKK
jgi:dihydrofolate reductase